MPPLLPPPLPRPLPPLPAPLSLLPLPPLPLLPPLPAPLPAGLTPTNFNEVSMKRARGRTLWVCKGRILWVRGSTPSSPDALGL
jgi:hypothetical protein